MSNSFVYFIHAVGTDRVKIGYSSDPDDRMAELKIGSPFPLRILHRFPGGRKARVTRELVLAERTQRHAERIEQNAYQRQLAGDFEPPLCAMVAGGLR